MTNDSGSVAPAERSVETSTRGLDATSAESNLEYLSTSESNTSLHDTIGRSVFQIGTKRRGIDVKGLPEIASDSLSFMSPNTTNYRSNPTEITNPGAPDSTTGYGFNRGGSATHQRLSQRKACHGADLAFAVVAIPAQHGEPAELLISTSSSFNYPALDAEGERCSTPSSVFSQFYPVDIGSLVGRRGPSVGDSGRFPPICFLDGIASQVSRRYHRRHSSAPEGDDWPGRPHTVTRVHHTASDGTATTIDLLLYFCDPQLQRRLCHAWVAYPDLLHDYSRNQILEVRSLQHLLHGASPKLAEDVVPRGPSDYPPGSLQRQIRLNHQTVVDLVANLLRGLHVVVDQSDPTSPYLGAFFSDNAVRDFVEEAGARVRGGRITRPETQFVISVLQRHDRFSLTFGAGCDPNILELGWGASMTHPKSECLYVYDSHTYLPGMPWGLKGVRRMDVGKDKTLAAGLRGGGDSSPSTIKKRFHQAIRNLTTLCIRDDGYNRKKPECFSCGKPVEHSVTGLPWDPAAEIDQGELHHAESVSSLHARLVQPPCSQLDLTPGEAQCLFLNAVPEQNTFRTGDLDGPYEDRDVSAETKDQFEARVLLVRGLKDHLSNPSSLILLCHDCHASQTANENRSKPQGDAPEANEEALRLSALWLIQGLWKAGGPAKGLLSPEHGDTGAIPSMAAEDALLSGRSVATTHPTFHSSAPGPDDVRAPATEPPVTGLDDEDIGAAPERPVIFWSRGDREQPLVSGPFTPVVQAVKLLFTYCSPTDGATYVYSHLSIRDEVLGDADFLPGRSPSTCDVVGGLQARCDPTIAASAWRIFHAVMEMAPGGWNEALALALARDPEGHSIARVLSVAGRRCEVHVWAVPVASSVTPRLKKPTTRIDPGTADWREDVVFVERIPGDTLKRAVRTALVCARHAKQASQKAFQAEDRLGLMLDAVRDKTDLDEEQLAHLHSALRLGLRPTEKATRLSLNGPAASRPLLRWVTDQRSAFFTSLFASALVLAVSARGSVPSLPASAPGSVDGSEDSGGTSDGSYDVPLADGCSAPLQILRHQAKGHLYREGMTQRDAREVLRALGVPHPGRDGSGETSGPGACFRSQCDVGDCHCDARAEYVGWSPAPVSEPRGIRAVHPVLDRAYVLLRNQFLGKYHVPGMTVDKARLILRHHQRGGRSDEDQLPCAECHRAERQTRADCECEAAGMMDKPPHGHCHSCGGVGRLDPLDSCGYCARHVVLPGSAPRQPGLTRKQVKQRRTKAPRPGNRRKDRRSPPMELEDRIHAEAARVMELFRQESGASTHPGSGETAAAVNGPAPRDIYRGECSSPPVAQQPHDDDADQDGLPSPSDSANEVYILLRDQRLSKYYFPDMTIDQAEQVIRWDARREQSGVIAQQRCITYQELDEDDRAMVDQIILGGRQGDSDITLEQLTLSRDFVACEEFVANVDGFASDSNPGVVKVSRRQRDYREYAGTRRPLNPPPTQEELDAGFIYREDQDFDPERDSYDPWAVEAEPAPEAETELATADRRRAPSPSSSTLAQRPRTGAPAFGKEYSSDCTGDGPAVTSPAVSDCSEPSVTVSVDAGIVCDTLHDLSRHMAISSHLSAAPLAADVRTLEETPGFGLNVSQLPYQYEVPGVLYCSEVIFCQIQGHGENRRIVSMYARSGSSDSDEHPSQARDGVFLHPGWEHRGLRTTTIGEDTIAGCSRELCLPASWQVALVEEVIANPHGHALARTQSDSRQIHVWAVEVPHGGPPPRAKIVRSRPYAWRAPKAHQEGICDHSAYQLAVQTALDHVGWSFDLPPNPFLLSGSLFEVDPRHDLMPTRSAVSIVAKALSRAGRLLLRSSRKQGCLDARRNDTIRSLRQVGRKACVHIDRHLSFSAPPVSAHLVAVRVVEITRELHQSLQAMMHDVDRTLGVPQSLLQEIRRQVQPVLQKHLDFWDREEAQDYWDREDTKEWWAEHGESQQDHPCLASPDSCDQAYEPLTRSRANFLLADAGLERLIRPGMTAEEARLIVQVSSAYGRWRASIHPDDVHLVPLPSGNPLGSLDAGTDPPSYVLLRGVGLESLFNPSMTICQARILVDAVAICPHLIPRPAATAPLRVRALNLRGDYQPQEPPLETSIAIFGNASIESSFENACSFLTLNTQGLQTGHFAIYDAHDIVWDLEENLDYVLKCSEWWGKDTVSRLEDAFHRAQLVRLRLIEEYDRTLRFLVHEHRNRPHHHRLRWSAAEHAATCLTLRALWDVHSPWIAECPELSMGPRGHQAFSVEVESDPRTADFKHSRASMAMLLERALYKNISQRDLLDMTRGTESAVYIEACDEAAADVKKLKDVADDLCSLCIAASRTDLPNHDDPEDDPRRSVDPGEPNIQWAVRDPAGDYIHPMDRVRYARGIFKLPYGTRLRLNLGNLHLTGKVTDGTRFARCVRRSCVCEASVDGRQGRHCCDKCLHGQPCVASDDGTVPHQEPIDGVWKDDLVEHILDGSPGDSEVCFCVPVSDPLSCSSSNVLDNVVLDVGLVRCDLLTPIRKRDAPGVTTRTFVQNDGGNPSKRPRGHPFDRDELYRRLAALDDEAPRRHGPAHEPGTVADPSGPPSCPPSPPPSPPGDAPPGGALPISAPQVDAPEQVDETPSNAGPQGRTEDTELTPQPDMGNAVAEPSAARLYSGMPMGQYSPFAPERLSVEDRLVDLIRHLREMAAAAPAPDEEGLANFDRHIGEWSREWHAERNHGEESHAAQVNALEAAIVRRTREVKELRLAQASAEEAAYQANSLADTATARVSALRTALAESRQEQEELTQSLSKDLSDAEQRAIDQLQCADDKFSTFEHTQEVLQAELTHEVDRLQVLYAESQYNLERLQQAFDEWEDEPSPEADLGAILKEQQQQIAQLIKNDRHRRHSRSPRRRSSSPRRRSPSPAPRAHGDPEVQVVDLGGVAGLTPSHQGGDSPSEFSYAMSTRTDKKNHPDVIEAMRVFDLPSEKKSLLYTGSPDHDTVLTVFSLKASRSGTCWHTRQTYTRETVEKWAVQSSSHDTGSHRAVQSTIRALETLKLPNGLRSPDAQTVTDSWDEFRPQIANALLNCVSVDADWVQVLRILNSIAHPKSTGQPRMQETISVALDDMVLIDNPCLHADVILAKWDATFSQGVAGYGKDSLSKDYDLCIARNKGEDALSLGTRLRRAYLKKLADVEITIVTVWLKMGYATEIAQRYCECLLNDLSDPARGKRSSQLFWQKWQAQRVLVQLKEASADTLDITRIAKIYLSTSEETCPGQSTDKQRDADRHGGRHVGGSRDRNGYPTDPALRSRYEKALNSNNHRLVNNINAIMDSDEGIDAPHDRHINNIERQPGLPPDPPPTPPGPPRDDNLSQCWRKTAAPRGSLGNPTAGSNWTLESWDRAIVNFDYFEELNNFTETAEAAILVRPTDKSMTALMLGRCRSVGGHWPEDACKYCKYRPLAKAGSPEANHGHADNWWYGMGRGDHSPYKCQAFKRMIAEGGDTKRHPNAAAKIRRALEAFSSNNATGKGQGKGKGKPFVGGRGRGKGN